MNNLLISIKYVVVGCDIGTFILSWAIKLNMGGQVAVLDGPHKGARPNKSNVTGSALKVINYKSQLSETDLAVRMDLVENLSVRGRAPLFMSITAWTLPFYYYEKQLTFQKPVSLKHRQKSILKMFSKSPDFMRQMPLIKLIGL